jgi:hypothetical protein
MTARYGHIFTSTTAKDWGGMDMTSSAPLGATAPSSMLTGWTLGTAG